MNRSRRVTSSVVFAVLVACSAATPGDPLSSATPVTESSLVGCTPLDDGCYTASGSYEPPTSTPSCGAPGGAASGSGDTHCKGVAPTAVTAASCGVMPPKDAGDDAGPIPASGICGENGPDYGATMYGAEGDDDDCKYHVTYTSSPICENDGTYFVVTASYLTGSGSPLTGACTFAELCLNDSHVIPQADSRPSAMGAGKQVVVEGPPGTYTIGPVEFDLPGKWTVRFHFNEQCCDVADSSPHGHAAFFLDVP